MTGRCDRVCGNCVNFNEIGCRIEHEAAVAYGMEVLYED